MHQFDGKNNGVNYRGRISVYRRRKIIKNQPTTVRATQSSATKGPESLNRRRSLFRLNNYLARLRHPIKHWHALLRPIPITITASILVALVAGAVYLIPHTDYRLTAKAQLLLSAPDAKLSSEVSYDTRSQSFIINGKGADKLTNSSRKILVGQPSTGLYTATLPSDLSHGITVTNNSAHIGFTLALESKTSPVKCEGGHFVYPAQDNMQAVYTPKADELTEDIILNHPEGNSLTLKYHLSLPKGLHGETSSNGPVVVGANGLPVFQFVRSVIRESDGQSGGRLSAASARLALTGNTLTLVANGLAHLTYPITIDPSILINSANGFLTGNNEGDVSATTNQFGEAGLSGGGMNTTWTTDTAEPLPQTLFYATSAVYNGYVYELGGTTGSSNQSTVYYAPLNSNGSLGAWITDTAEPLPQSLSQATSVAYDGYIYELGGIGTASTGDCNGSGLCNGVYYAPINSNGSVGTWVNDSANPLPQTIADATSVVYNGYIYEMGGRNSSTLSTVYYAPINSNGSVGTWVNDSANPLPQVLDYASSVVYNGYIYELGGYGTASTGDCNGSSLCNGVYYAPINANGSIGTWVNDSANPLPVALFYATSVAYNGYVYELGGYNNTSNQTTDYYAPINANGSIGTWVNDSANPLPAGLEHATSVAYNGYVYYLGGSNGSAQSTVYYDQIASAGLTSAYSSTTSLPTAIDSASSVAYNGYAYEIGGYNGSSTITTVDYAPINSIGTLGSWTATTSLPTALDNATSIVYNGYIYEIGGQGGTNNPTTTVDYAPINSNGTLGSWTATTSLPTAVYGATSVINGGYVYEIGGYNSGDTAVVDYAPINSSGTLGSWTATTSLPAANGFGASVVDNGYIYAIGGDSLGTSVYSAPINSSGTIGSWTATTSLIGGNGDAGKEISSLVYNGYVYDLGGCGITCPNTLVEYTVINNGGAGTVQSWTTDSSNPLSQALYSAASVTDNGYIYELGGCGSTNCPTNSVYYAPISNTGSIGAWTADTTLSTGAFTTARQGLSAVAYNSYLYIIGGTASGTDESDIQYAAINSNGSLSAPSSCPGGLATGNSVWCKATAFTTARQGLSAAVYNGNLYITGGQAASSTGGCTATGDYCNDVQYDSINANGSLGGTWTDDTSLSSGAFTTARDYQASLVYNGNLYIVGGNANGTDEGDVQYASIGSSGSLAEPSGCAALASGNSIWCETTVIPTARQGLSAVAYNGNLYILGGQAGASIGDCTATSDYCSGVYYASIITNGSIGTWTSTTTLSQSLSNATSVAYDGYVYELGGTNSGGSQSTVYYAGLNSIPRVGQYSMLVNIGNGFNVTPTAIVINGTNAGNPGTGGLAGLGGMTVQYENGTTSCSTFSSPTTVDLGSQEMGQAYILAFTSDGCSNTTNQSEYAWVHFDLDDSQTATFPDANSNHNTVTAFQIFYHTAVSTRLRGGMTLQNGVQQSLEAPPSTTQ